MQYDQKLKEIEREMVKLNKLTDKEKNIHTVWIGKPSENEFDNIKLWAQYNKEYKIYIWTDYDHILAHKLGNLIALNSKIKNNNDVIEHSYEKEAILKDKFYNNYQLNNSEKTFDENAKQFLINKKMMDEIDINKLIAEGKTSMANIKSKLQKYTPNEVNIMDVSKKSIWQDIFPNEKYYAGYLNSLEQLHIAASASDRIRYAVLNKLGGFYLDTDLMPNFDLDEFKKDKDLIDLIDLITYDENKITKYSKHRFDIILNKIIQLDKLNKLNNEEDLKDFAVTWGNVYNTSVDENYKNFIKIAKRYQEMNLKIVPNMNLSDFPINNSLQSTLLEKREHTIYNAMIASKKDAMLMQKLMEKIEVTDKKLQSMSTYKKLVNKNSLVFYHTGPWLTYYTTIDVDNDHFYQHEINTEKLITLKNIDSLNTTWFDSNIVTLKERITEDNEKRFLFLDHTKDLKSENYADRKEIRIINEKIKNNPDFSEEEITNLWKDSLAWFSEQIKTRDEIKLKVEEIMKRQKQREDDIAVQMKKIVEIEKEEQERKVLQLEEEKKKHETDRSEEEWERE